MSDENRLTVVARELFPAEMQEEGLLFEDKLGARAKILELEKLMMEAKGEQLQIKTTHTFAGGIYVREVFIPKGTLLIGKIHKHQCVSIMSMGYKTVLTEDGVRNLRAPYTAISRPGIKRVGFAHEDSVWTTIHKTDLTDIEAVEKELFTTDYGDVTEQDVQAVKFETMEGELCPQ